MQHFCGPNIIKRYVAFAFCNKKRSSYIIVMFYILFHYFMGCPVIQKLRKYDHISAGMLGLHWLKIREGIIFKIALLVYKCRTGLALKYLSYLLPPALPWVRLYLLLFLCKWFLLILVTCWHLYLSDIPVKHKIIPLYYLFNTIYIFTSCLSDLQLRSDLKFELSGFYSWACHMIACTLNWLASTQGASISNLWWEIQSRKKYILVVSLFNHKCHCFFHILCALLN